MCKQDLRELAIEIGETVPPNLLKGEIIGLIEKNASYEVELIEGIIEDMMASKKKLEADRLREEEKEEAARLQAIEALQREREFELEKLRLSNANHGGGRENVASGSKSTRDLHNLMPKFNSESFDISLYLVMFERQAQKLGIDRENFVSHLMPLLPYDIMQVMLREPPEKSDDYSHVKAMLQKRFKLSPEAFRIKFMKHQRRSGTLWKEFAYEAKNYLEEWLVGVQVSDFESLKDLMLTDVIKRRVNPEMRNHFIDDWGTLNSSSELVTKLDEYEIVRGVSTKAPNFVKLPERKMGNFTHSTNYKKGNNVDSSGDHFKSNSSKGKFPENKWDKDKWKDRNFEKRRVFKCFECGQADHLRPACPKLAKRAPTEGLNSLVLSDTTENALDPYMSVAKINGKEMTILRDTGSSIDLISRHLVTNGMLLGESVWVKQPLDRYPTCLPLAQIEIQDRNSGSVITKAAVISPELDQGYYLLGNRTAKLMERHKPQLLNTIVTRSKSRAAASISQCIAPTPQDAHSIIEREKDGEAGSTTAVICHSETSEKGPAVALPPAELGTVEMALLNVNKGEMINSQSECATLLGAREKIKSTDQERCEYINKNGLLFRVAQDRLGEERLQLLIPEKFRENVKKMCHEEVSAHLGVTKTKDKLLRYFYWPNCFKEVETYVQTCDSCQRVGKSGDKKKAPLKIVPVITEVFSKINIDACGPLPETPRGNKYLITAICMSSKYPDAIPVPDICSVSVTDALLNVFSRMGFPKEVRCDLGTSFTSNLTTEFFDKFGIKITHSSVSHPQSNPVERFHSTVKRLLKVLCLEAGTNWERHLPAALLALRTVTHESIGFSPSELIHGKNLRTPETLLYEHWVEPEGENLSVTEYVFNLINRLKRCQDLAVEKLEGLQEKRKLWYDRKAVKRQFREGDMVLVLATAKPNKLAVSWIGPGVVESKISETNYIIKLPGKRDRSQIYHINMLKPYHKRPEVINLLSIEGGDGGDLEQEVNFPIVESDPNIYDFEEIARDSRLPDRLDPQQMLQLQQALEKHADIFSNEPGVTDLVIHDIDLVSEQPVRSKPYRMSPRRTEILKLEIERMLKMGIVEIGESDFTSPMILVEAPNKDPRPCIDYRRLNRIIRTEFFPLPNIEERVERVASAKFISILDLSKGYWQIKLSPKAQRIAAFVTSFGTYRPLKMPFGLKNAPFFFSKLMAQILQGYEGFAVPYLDDIAIFSDTWDEHLKHLTCILEKLSKSHLTIKPSKCRFAQDHVKYLGHMVGNGFRTPAEAKIQTIVDYPQPTTKTQLRAFLGLAGYYGHYIPQFSVTAAPLTSALKGKVRRGDIRWTEGCNQAFLELKKQLTQDPVLFAPVFTKEFIVQVDASNIRMGIILSQKDDQDEEHPVLYLSKKFSKAEQNYSTTERECASIIYAIKRLHYYLDGPKFTIVTDHNPLVWLNKNSSSNPRLLRWSLALQPFNFEVVHRAGKKHQNADCLSRIE